MCCSLGIISHSYIFFKQALGIGNWELGMTNECTSFNVHEVT